MRACMCAVAVVGVQLQQQQRCRLEWWTACCAMRLRAAVVFPVERALVSDHTI